MPEDDGVTRDEKPRVDLALIFRDESWGDDDIEGFSMGEEEQDESWGDDDVEGCSMGEEEQDVSILCLFRDDVDCSKILFPVTGDEEGVKMSLSFWDEKRDESWEDVEGFSMNVEEEDVSSDDMEGFSMGDGECDDSAGDNGLPSTVSVNTLLAGVLSWMISE